MSTPSSDDLWTPSALIAALSGQVSGLLSQITELEWQPRSGITGPPTTPKQQGSKCLDKSPSGHAQCIVTVSFNAVPLTFPLAQDLLKGTSSANQFTMICVISDACGSHMIGR
jgi:hypothetical protein